MAENRQNCDEIRTEKRLNIYATSFFIFLMFIIGLPLWWTTTSVYRVYLPSDAIENLNNVVLQFPVTIKFIFSEEKQRKIVEKTSEILTKRLANVVVEERVGFKLEFLVEKASEKYAKSLETSKNVEELDEKITASCFQSLNDFALNFLFLPENFVDETFSEIYFGCGSVFYVKNKAAQTEKLASMIEESLTKNYLKLRQLGEIVEKNLKRSENFDVKKQRKTIMQTNFESKYTFEISVIVPDPSNCRPKFDAKKTFDKDFQPFVDAVKPLTTIRFKSQVLYYVDFDVKPIRKETDGQFYYQSSQLPHLINSIETYTGGFDAEEPLFRVVLYVTPPAKRPLFIVDEKSGISPGNSFVVSSWGGVVVVNDERVCANGTFDADVQNVILSHVRHLLGFAQSATKAADGKFKKTTKPSSSWEIQSLLYEATTDYFWDSVTTINSLTKLIQRIYTLSINADIGEAVQSAVRSAESAIDTLRTEKTVVVACQHAKHARDNAEKAFFDPSLLADLYFPEDQKYAIYIPLFLPVGFPIVLSVKLIYTYLKNERERRRQEDKEE